MNKKKHYKENENNSQKYTNSNKTRSLADKSREMHTINQCVDPFHCDQDPDPRVRFVK